MNKKMLKLRPKPWIDLQILEIIKIRDKLFKQFKDSNSSPALKAYKQFRNRVVNEIRQSKKNYYQEYFHENKSNMKMLWKGIKNIISLKPKTCDAFSHLVSDDGSKISEPVNIANEFNEYFTKVADEITKKIPRTWKSPLSYLANPNLNSLIISPCTTNEVSTAIKSSGPNSIPVKLLKLLDDSISSDLSILINESFAIDIFPDKLKLAKVIPIFKKGVRTKTSNYRPISLLSTFSKIFEKLMQTRLQKFLETCDVLFSMQFGFRSGHSTEHALISLTESIKTTLDNKRLGCGIFIDLQKAFDTVNHEILLNKLEHYGIRGTALAWFESYLTNRRQSVSINGYSSSMCSISCGVPQGSVLGPLLFLIYINDLPNVSSMLSFFLFADDTNIYLEAGDLNSLTQTINKELSKVKSWLDCNKLALNIDKTNFVLFHSPRKILPDQINIKFGHKKVSRAKYVKFLGILLDEHLSWKYHITELHKKLSKTSGIFFKIRHYIPLQPLISLYHSLFSSFLSYGITAWGLTYGTYLKPLFLLQKKILRCISFQNFIAPSAPIFHSLKILKLEDMIHSNVLNFAYKAMNKLSPTCFHNFFTPNSSVHRFGTRQVTRGDLFKSLKNTTLYGLKTIQYFGSKLWNTLPLFIRVSGSASVFRSNLKTFFLDSYLNQ
ncbi:MAG: reverse transcriptase family protein [Flavobacteriaceae bacterium]|nr:reverse transcriptase family protein [Flavobacteriaceae bacterium]